MMKNWLLSAGLLAAVTMVVLPGTADSVRTPSDIANAQDLFRRLQEIGRGGRTLHELATAPGVAFSVMTTYDGPCTFPNTAAGKREMAEFLAAPETVVDDWNGKPRDAAAFVDPFVGTKFPGNTLNKRKGR